MEFASMIPYMDKDVTIAIINQFPVYADFGKVTIEQYTQACSNILEKNRESQMTVINGYQTILDALAKRIEKENISEIERKSITEDMIAVADKIAEADIQNKNFLERMGSKLLWAVGIVFVAIGAGIEIHSAFGDVDSLPQVSGDEEER
ncbi:MAG: hypothetical protein PUC30_11010 [Lachnospiraceae bacterium]|nr:hypothetical protein [Lachnospiraceae bacterium]